MHFIWDTFNPYRAKLIQAYGQSFIKPVVKTGNLNTKTLCLHICYMSKYSNIFL